MPKYSFQPLITKLRSIWQSFIESLPQLIPGTEIISNIEKVIFVFVLILAAFQGFQTKTGLGWFLDSFIGLILGFLAFRLIVWAGEPLIQFAFNFPPRLWAIFGVGLWALLMFWSVAERHVSWVSSAILLSIFIVVGIFTAVKLGNISPSRKTVLQIVQISFIAVLVGVAYWFFFPGTDAYLLNIEPYQGTPSIQAPNPAQPGEYDVLTLTYGSGENPRRPEFGEQADLVTNTVSVRSFMGLEKIEEITRRWYWGFGLGDFPINGQVWYPDGDGSFPLVLIVHGNHDMSAPSDNGYAYLGELLASRGYIFVSVDENFFNGYFSGGVSGENDARAWVLLKHLEVWDAWNRGSGNTVFKDIVDMENIALMGHSRGGEAAALAAVLNRQTRYSENGNIRFDFHYDIKTIIAIAPSDQQYKPAGQPAPLTDINYLVLQGAHDADISTYSGLRQYQRVTFTDPTSEWVKAGLYIYQANHGQFNTVWGRRDFSLPRGWFLNTQPLLDGAQQRQIAKLYISAFLDATLKDGQVYLPLFQNYQNAGDWLPPTLYINQYQDAAFQPLATFEEDINLTTATVSNVSLNGHGLWRWREDELEFRKNPDQENQAAFIGWNNRGDRYSISLPVDLPRDWEISPDHYLIFSLADGRNDPGISNQLNFSIVLKEQGGQESRLILDDILPLNPQFYSVFTKLPSWEDSRYKKPQEPILQTYRIPLSQFIQQSPEFDLSLLHEIIFQFDQTQNGEIILDDIGISGP